MSTKIYNGIKFKSNDFNVVLKQLKDLRKPAKDIALKELKESKIRVFIGLNDLINSDPYEILKEMEISSNKTYRNHSDMLINFHVIIFPHKNGNIYGYYFNDIDEYSKLIKNISDDYHYQNSTDMSNYDWDKEDWNTMSKERQDELEKDWEERCEIWEELMGDRTFVENGFLYEIVDGGRDLWGYRIVDDIKIIQDKLKLILNRKNKLNNLK